MNVYVSIMLSMDEWIWLHRTAHSYFDWSGFRFYIYDGVCFNWNDL